MLLFDFEQMCNDLMPSKSVAIYGVDENAKIVKDECLKRKIPVIALLKHTVEYAGNSFNEDAPNFDGIPVFYINEIPKGILNMLKTGECSLILPTPDAVAENNLNYLNIKYKKLIDYHIAGGYIINAQGNWSKEQWIAHIDKWYAHEHSGEITQIEQPKNGEHKDKAIIVAMGAHNRMVKILRALKYHNIEAEYIFLDEQVGNSQNYKIIESEAASCRIVDSMIDVLHILAHADASFMFMFTHAWTLDPLLLIRYIIQRKNYLYPVVFDSTDWGLFYLGVPQNNLIAEKDCAEMADVVTDRSYQAGRLVELGTYKLQGKRVQLIDCCADIPMPNVVLKDNRPLSLIWAGMLEFNMPERYYGPHGLFDFIDACEENKCHFYVYTIKHVYEQCKNNQYAEYIRRSNESEYFHFCVPVPFDEIIKIMAQRDYGVMPLSKKVDLTKPWGVYNPEEILYASSQRWYDFLTAGIPLAGCFPAKQLEFLSQFGVVVNYGREEFDFEYLKAHRDEYRARVPAAREKLMMKDHIVNLLDAIMPDRKVSHSY